MNLRVECDGCLKEEAPLYLRAVHQHMPPAGWREVEEFLFCVTCWPHVRIAIERTTADLLRKEP